MSAAEPVDSPVSRWLQIDDQIMQRGFDREPFTLRHTLCDHPLLQLPRIIELARTLPKQSVEYNAGDLPLDQDPQRTPRNGLSIDETLRRIEDCRSWMVLKNVQQEPHYKRLLDQCMDQIRPLVEHVAPGMRERKAFIFVSSPGAITPYHADFEYNLLLQVRGEKVITVFDPVDRVLFSEVQREQFVSGAHRNLVWRDEFTARGRPFHLTPGIGVHVPLTSPHWVRVGDQPSVSFSITFQSQRSDRLELAHLANAKLRQFGLTPYPAGSSALRDAVKVFGYRILRKWQRLRGNVDTPARRPY